MRPLRSGKPGTIFEVTSRTIKGQMRLVPTDDANDVIVGCIGRARSLYDVKLYGLVFLSNHYHMLIGAPDAQVLARFMGHINGNITRELNRLHKTSGPMWHRRYRAIPLSERVGVARMRMRYILSHGVKEKLVAKVRHWPGVSGARWMLDGTVMTGTWTDRTARYRDQQAGVKKELSAYQTGYELTVDPLPELADTPVAAQRAQWREMVDEIEVEYAALREQENVAVLGVAGVLARDPLEFPAACSSGRAPSVHAEDAADRRRCKEALRALRTTYLEASAAFRRREWSVEFPAGMFRPAGPFVSWPKSEVAAAVSAAAA